MKFYSQLNTSGREPIACDTPVSHSIDIPTEALKVMRSYTHTHTYTVYLFETHFSRWFVVGLSSFFLGGGWVDILGKWAQKGICVCMYNIYIIIY